VHYHGWVQEGLAEMVCDLVVLLSQCNLLGQNNAQLLHHLVKRRQH
jgi:hypothetical protein